MKSTRLLFVMLAAVGCGTEGSGKITVPAREAAATKDPNASAPPSTEGPLGGDAEVDPSQAVADDRILDVTMRLTASAIGIEGCSGDLGIRFRLQLDEKNGGRAFEVPKDTVSCLIVGNIDLKKILQSPEPPGRPEVKAPFVVDEGVIATKLIGQGYFPETPSPLLPSLFAATPEELKKLNVYRLLKATDWANKKSANGTATLKTIAYKASHYHEPLQREFKEVYDFELTHTGFSGIGKVKTMLWDRMMLRISLKPLAFLRIEMKFTAGDLLAAAQDKAGQPAGEGGEAGGGILGGILGGGGGGSGGGGILGGILGGGGGGAGGLISGIVSNLTVNIEGDMIDQVGLPKAGEEHTDDGVVVGGGD